jgi:RNA polymerase sigma-70 factor (ECF subfamily)
MEDRFLSAYDDHGDAIFRFCYAQTGRRELALDLTQDTYARVWRHMSQGKTIEDIRPFLYTTARHAIIDHARRHQPQSLDVLREEGFDIADDHAADPLLSATAAHALKILSHLEQPYREAVSLRYVDDLMPREIAQLTGESENVISVRISRGLKQLKELLHL